MILPVATGVLQWLTPIAAAGFAAIQVLAIRVHVRPRETRMLPLNLLLLGLSGFVVWGHWGLLGA